jgi:hypothetical protein
VHQGLLAKVEAASRRFFFVRLRRIQAARRRFHFLIYQADSKIHRRMLRARAYSGSGTFISSMSMTRSGVMFSEFA